MTKPIPSRPSILKILSCDGIACGCMLFTFGFGIFAVVFSNEVPIFLFIASCLLVSSIVRTIFLRSFHKRAVIIDGKVTRVQVGIRGPGFISYAYSYKENSYEDRKGLWRTFKGGKKLGLL